MQHSKPRIQHPLKNIHIIPILNANKNQIGIAEEQKKKLIATTNETNM